MLEDSIDRRAVMKWGRVGVARLHAGGVIVCTFVAARVASRKHALSMLRHSVSSLKHQCRGKGSTWPSTRQPGTST